MFANIFMNMLQFNISNWRQLMKYKQNAYPFDHESSNQPDLTMSNDSSQLNYRFILKIYYYYASDNNDDQISELMLMLLLILLMLTKIKNLQTTWLSQKLCVGWSFNLSLPFNIFASIIAYIAVLVFISTLLIVAIS